MQHKMQKKPTRSKMMTVEAQMEMNVHWSFRKCVASLMSNTLCEKHAGIAKCRKFYGLLTPVAINN